MLLRRPVEDRAASDAQVRQLSESKERLQAELAALLPWVERLREAYRRRPEQFTERLPEHAAFVDFVRYEPEKNSSSVQHMRHSLCVVSLIVAVTSDVHQDKRSGTNGEYFSGSTATPTPPSSWPRASRSAGSSWPAPPPASTGRSTTGDAPSPPGT